MIKNNSFRVLICIFFIFIIAIFQTYSLWLPIDEKVDESELVYFAVGFFGGDLDPHWYGYGNIAMYFLSVIYGIVYFFNFSLTLDEYALKLFDSDYFIHLGRYIFSLIGVFTTFIYLYILNKYIKNLYYVGLFGIVIITSYDSIYYSNYIRLDQLVALLIPIILYFSINMNRRNFFIFSSLIGIVVAIKISTLGLIFLFLIFSYTLYIKKEITIKDIFLAALLILFTVQVLQPYNNIFSFLESAANRNSIEISILSKFETLYRSVLNNILSNINIYVLYILIFFPWAAFYYRKLTLYTVLVFVLLLVPYLAGSGITRKYWLISNYDLVYFLAALSVFSFLRFLTQFNRLLSSGFLICIIGVIAYVTFLQINQYKNILKHFNGKISNQKIATKWIEENLLKNSDIVIYMDMHKNYNLPRVYNKNDFELSRNLTRDFIYNRKSNEYLKQIFFEYLENIYLNESKVDDKKNKYAKVFPLRASKVDDNFKKKISGAYFITSPSIYKTFIGKSKFRQGHKVVTVKEVFDKYYRFMTRREPFKKFANGYGDSIEIYKFD